MVSKPRGLVCCSRPTLDSSAPNCRTEDEEGGGSLVGAVIGMVVLLSLTCIVAALLCSCSWRPVCTCCEQDPRHSFSHPLNQVG
jgi:hypothetical protein